MGQAVFRNPARPNPKSQRVAAMIGEGIETTGGLVGLVFNGVFGFEPGALPRAVIFRAFSPGSGTAKRDGTNRTNRTDTLRK